MRVFIRRLRARGFPASRVRIPLPPSRRPPRRSAKWRSATVEGSCKVARLEALLRDYQDPTKVDKIAKVDKSLAETKEVLTKTIDAVLARGEKLDDLVDRSAELSASSKMFYKTAKSTNSCVAGRRYTARGQGLSAMASCASASHFCARSRRPPPQVLRCRLRGVRVNGRLYLEKEIELWMAGRLAHAWSGGGALSTAAAAAAGAATSCAPRAAAPPPLALQQTRARRRP